MDVDNFVTDVCGPASECQPFRDEQRELGQLSVGSAEYKEKRKSLVDLICNSREKRVCCATDVVVSCNQYKIKQYCKRFVLV